MTTPTFEDLAKFGIQNKPVDDYIEDLADFLVENGLEIPEDPSPEYLAGLNEILEHAGFLSSDMTAAEYIAQWGVLGMKWGKRKSRDGKYEINTQRQAGNHPGHGEGGDKLNKPAQNGTSSTSSAKPRAKSAKEMTTVELQEVINRFKLEQQYNQIIAPKDSPLTAATKKILKDAAKKEATAYASKAMSYLAAKAIKAGAEALKNQQARK